MAEKRQKPGGWEWTGHGVESQRLGYWRDGALAVEAVIGELVSAPIPCFAGKYREFLPLEAR